MTLREALVAELEMLDKRYRNEIESVKRLLEEYAGRAPSTHLGHNLSARAAELSVLAGKVEAVKAVLAHVMSEALDAAPTVKV